MIIHVSFARFYEFDGWLFDWNRNKPFGPWPCKKNLEPRKRAGRKFYDAFQRFQDMPIAEQEKCRMKDAK